MFDFFFLIFAQNIDCGYTLEPPRRGASNEYPQNRYTPANTTFTILKWGLMGVFIARTCFPDESTGLSIHVFILFYPRFIVRTTHRIKGFTTVEILLSGRRTCCIVLTTYACLLTVRFGAMLPLDSLVMLLFFIKR